MLFGQVPQANVKTIRLALSANRIDYGLITDPLIYQPNFPPPNDVLERFDNRADLILAPVRSKQERGLILLKRVWLVFNKMGDPIQGTLSVYLKGNEPADGDADQPDYTTTFTIQNGNVFIDVPHLLSESFILRLRWTPDIVTPPDGRVLYAGVAWECNERIINKVKLLRIAVDVEEYGEANNVTGEDYRGGL